MILTAILSIFIGLLSLIIFILWKSLNNSKKEISEKKSLIASMQFNNRELRKTLQEIQIIEEQRKEKINDIKKSPDDNIVNILNDKLQDNKRKSKK